MAWIGLAIVIAGCDRHPKTEPNDPTPSASASGTHCAEVSSQMAQRQAAQECMRMRELLATQPALPGAPRMETMRTEILGRAKGSPVVFIRPPRRDGSLLPMYVRDLAVKIDDPATALESMKRLRSLLQFQREAVRAVVLPEGYLYAESPDLAEWLVTWFKLEHLFDESELWLMRGTEIRRLVRTEAGYRYGDGPDAGREASLLMFDRLAAGREALLPALHIDLRSACAQGGFDRVRVERITQQGVSAVVRYGAADSRWIPAVFEVEQAQARLGCEAIEPEQMQAVSTLRAEKRELDSLAHALRPAVQMQVDENLPFDEPREEQGQQDGSLRPQWAWAYRHGWDGYSFNNLSYPVFDTQGRPVPPQVCIDFVLDTYERASGTWYRGRGEPRERLVGRLDFEQLAMPNRRGVESVVNFFRSHPEMFEIWDLPAEERVRYRDHQAFFQYLEKHADEFRPPDIIVIHGPKGAENHYHSFFVYETDPVTGVPILLAGNAGKPRVRSWSAVMLSAPLRSIKHRLRPRQEWLRNVVASLPPT
jgi:hypothetical protein